MRTLIPPTFMVLMVLLMPLATFAQAPNLGVASTFAVFTGIGAFNNDGTTMITGDIGTNIGPFAGFPPGTVDGTIHVQDAVSLQASTDVGLAYSYLSAITCDVVLGVGLGNNQVLSPNVYCIGAAATLDGDLILDGQGDPDALFIFQINGALSTGVNSRVLLINGASLCNVYWQINGAVALGDLSIFLGTFIANGQITALEGATVLGRALATVGAVSLHNNVIRIGLPPIPSVIAANGPITFCEGNSVVLSGNVEGIWNTGETTPTITVSTSGDYFVTNTTICSSESSNHIIVTVNPLPTVVITPGVVTFCQGDGAMLTANASTNVSYLWSTGAMTQSITVTTAGAYSVTVTDANGCMASASAIATVNALPVVTITPSGPTTFCEGGDVILCASSGTAYLWSTGATGQCITVSATGNYTITLTDGNDCSDNTSISVTVNPLPSCTITGNASFCTGQSTELCVAPGFASYLWSTGATGNCITVTSAGTYSVTLTDANGCSSSCSQLVTVGASQSCSITGPPSFCTGESTQLCVDQGFASYLWSTGATSTCISVSSAGNYSVTVTDANGCQGVCNQIVTENPMPSCDISGNPTFCTGQSTQLCASPGFASYLWSTGATGTCISVTIAGNYSVTVTDANGCQGVCSQIVTENPLPSCDISGNPTFCTGQSTQLCASPGFASYLWSTGATGSCISVSSAGNYSVTVTDGNGCEGVCSQIVIENPMPSCDISGNPIFCTGESTQLCASPGFASYLWSTGATGTCITVTIAGTYSVTVTDANGCEGICSQIVTENPMPSCDISGNPIFCTGQSTQLCASPGFASYLWSTGATSTCISVSIAGNYSVTVTDGNGCEGVCSEIVMENPLPICSIIGEDLICPGETTQLCTPAGAFGYVWSNGATTNCITVSTPGLFSVTITDINGCNSTCDHLVVLEDVIPPVITCPIGIVIECGESTLPSNTGAATATDNCIVLPVISFNDGIVAGELCPLAYTILRNWTATDGGGNSVFCVQTIRIEDTTAPFMECPANLIVQCPDQVPAVDLGLVMASDACDQNLMVIHAGDVITTQTCENNYVLERTYRATDACGNANECIQLITVRDQIAPTITLVNPLLASGDTIRTQCFGQDPDWSLPLYNEGSVTATDECGGMVSIVFTHALENEGTCAEDGYVSLFRLTWTATDLCGNSSKALLFLALVDNIAPIIYGVPEDITVNCDEIPELPGLVFATDECLCACVISFEETLPTSACLDGQVLVRTWTATDRCGNTTTQSQNITLVDHVGPQWQFVVPELGGLEDGAILEYTCTEGGIPAFFNFLSAYSVFDPYSCGATYVLSFDSTTIVSNNCEAAGYVEQRTYRWTGYDECGNQSELVLIARLIDNEAPILIGVVDTLCLGDPALDEVSAIDNCTQASIHLWDVNIANSCGSETVIRTYEAVDDCGNTSRATTVIFPNVESNPVITFSNLVLADIAPEDTIRLDLASLNGSYTSFGITDIQVEDSCAAITLSFSENLIALGDCSIDGVVALIELQWTAIDLCGNISELRLLANIVDESSPVFPNFVSEMTIGCQDTVPMPFARDNSGSVVMTTVDSLILGPCDFEYDLLRLVTATDPCGNATTLEQMIHVGNGEGPIMEGIDPVICEDLTIPEVRAYDACAGEYVEVAMHQDTLESPCEGLVISRTWTAVNSCGHVSERTQIVILYDETPPKISIPPYSVIRNYLDYDLHLVYLGQIYVINDLNALNESSVIVSDDCDQTIIPVFTVVITHPEDCETAGYLEERVYTWIATDACGNSMSLSFTVNIVDDIPPVFYGAPDDMTIECAPLPPVPEIFVDDTTHQGNIDYTQTIEAGEEAGVFIVTRTWVATDACGNISVYVQTITWIPDTFLECAIILPDHVECNSHGIVISSEFTGGLIYDWEIVGEECFIQGGQNTPEMSMYIGWSPVKIILTVTDSFGCASMCMAFLDCSSIYSRDSLGIMVAEGAAFSEDITIDPSTGTLQDFNLRPNPATERVFLSFDSNVEEVVDIQLVTVFKEVIFSEKMTTQIGTNSYTIDVSQVPKGSYVVLVKTAKEVQTKVIVIL